MTTYWVDWRSRAACLGKDPELFFPVGSGEQALRQTERAKQVCLGCTVSDRCRDTAISHGYEGVWGGLDDEQRRRARRHRLIAHCRPDPSKPGPGR